MVKGGENLKPIRTREEAQERGRKGGRASAAARRERKALREVCQAALDALVTGEDGQEMTTREALVAVQIAKALSGDAKAFELLRDMAGEKPTDKVTGSISNGLVITWQKNA